MLVVGLFRPVTLDSHHVENDGVMDDAVNSGHRCHWVFEDAIPLVEDEIGCEDHRLAFISLGQEREEYFHLVSILLHIANIIENDAGKAI